MADLTLYGRRIETVFDLLGDAEDDITYSVGWGLSQSEDLTRALLRDIFGAAEQGEVTAVRLQESEPGTGRTDIEVETEFLRLVIEAKRGWQLPHRDQLQLYASRLNSHDSRHKRIAVVAEAAPHFPPVAALPSSLDGVPVTYLPWSRVAALVHDTARASGRARHGRLLHDLHRYLRSLMTMQNTTSNLVYVVVLNDNPLDWSDLTFKQIVCERLRCVSARALSPSCHSGPSRRSRPDAAPRRGHRHRVPRCRPS